MSFAIVAVILLLAAGASTALLSVFRQQDGENELSEEYIDAMLRCAGNEGASLRKEAQTQALDVARECPTGNESSLQQRFLDLWANRIAAIYPKQAGAFCISIERDSTSLSFLSLSVDGLPQYEVPEGVQSNQFNGTIPAFLTVTGYITFNLSCDRGSLSRRVEMDERVYSPIPLLQNRLGAFMDEVRDDNGDVQSIVRYELSALIQKRALEARDLFSATASWELISEGDVKNAVTIALIIEQVRVFRTYDWESGHATLAEIACSEESLSRTERVLASCGDLDPAELFLNLIGEDTLDPTLIVAQSLYAVADVLVLRWLDYLGIADVAKFMEQNLDRLTITIARVLGAVFGCDPLNDLALNWIKERMAAAGYDEGSYRYMFSGSPDASVAISGASTGFYGEDGERVSVSLDGVWAIDFPKVDLFASSEWEEFFVSYKTNTFEMAEMLEQLIKSVAVSVARSIDKAGCELSLDPLDGRNFLDSVKDSVSRCLVAADGAISDAFSRTIAEGVHDPMATALVRFVGSRWMEIFQANGSVDWAIHELAWEIACARLADRSQSDIATAAAAVELMIHTSPIGVEEAVQAVFHASAMDRANTFADVFSSVMMDGAPVAFANAIARLAIGLVRGVPGSEQAVKAMCVRMIDDLCAGSSIRGDVVIIPLRAIGPLELRTGNGEMFSVALMPDVDVGAIVGGLRCRLTYPDEYSRDSEDYPNLHVTDILNLTLCPFESQFEVEYTAAVVASLACVTTVALMGSDNPVLTMEAPLSARFTLFTCSGWPLQGVEYAPTMTLVKQIAQVLQWIWDGLVGALTAVWDGLNAVWRWISDALSTVMSWALKVVEFLADALSKIVQTVKDLIAGAIGGLAEWLGEAISTSLGKIAIGFSLFGISWIIETDLSDIAYGRSRDFLRVTGTFALCGVTLSGSMRIASIHDKGTDVLFNGTAMGDGWMVQASLDPLMFVTDRFLSVVGSFSGLVIEMSMPKVVQYDRLMFSLSDIPAIGSLLSRIPLPIPGVTGALDAGFELRYNSPIDDHLMINEVELNPPGQDAGKEWIELYNPTNSAVYLDGWYFETKHGIQQECYLESEIIPAKGRFVHCFDRLTLDNGGENGMPLGESIVLHDPSGKSIDSTPFLTDYFNDDRTWQRRSDGADDWTFKESSCGAPNSNRLNNQNDKDLLLHELGDAALRGMAKAQLDGSLGIDTLANLVRCVVDEVVDQAIDTLSDAVVEIGLYVELRLPDYSGTVGGSFRLSLSVTGDFVREGLEWIAGAVRMALGAFGNPSAVAPKAHSLDQLADDVWVKFGAYLSVSLPSILGRVSGERFTFGGEAHVNLASFVPSGEAHQNWSAAFGVLFKGVPGRYLSTCLSVNPDKLVDCWLLYATIHAPGYGADSV